MSTSQLDRELERVLSASEQGKKAAPTPPTAPPARRGNLVLLLVLLVMAGGIVALVMTSFNDAAVYAKNVDQVLSERTKLSGRRLRVEGNLVHHSLVFRDQPCEYRFVIHGKEGAELPVRYAQCVVPDTFKDVDGMDVGVTVEGKLAAGGGFEATQVLAKCPSKYEMKERRDHGEQMPHAAIPPS
jgi:cytochrome c-type biogenesis protein CcmE